MEVVLTEAGVGLGQGISAIGGLLLDQLFLASDLSNSQFAALMRRLRPGNPAATALKVIIVVVGGWFAV